jgi:uncharacterized membrane protein
MFMRWRVISWVGSFTMVFLFLPSLAIKIWDYLMGAPWKAKSWIFYMMMGLLVVFWVRWRWHRHKRLATKLEKKEEVSLLFLAKERLVKGEISLEEFREIRQELD